uniref:Uncharacterized protein n=1 Tax=Romanomermis culicivorax TaxID=13658 RepID=A0A915HMI2_ROMCU
FILDSIVDSLVIDEWLCGQTISDSKQISQTDYKNITNSHITSAKKHPIKWSFYESYGKHAQFILLLGEQIYPEHPHQACSPSIFKHGAPTIEHWTIERRQLSADN